MKFRASPGISTFGSLIEQPHLVSHGLYYTSRIRARFPSWLSLQRAYDLALVFPRHREKCVPPAIQQNRR
jgi:hypothetical protein